MADHSGALILGTMMRASHWSSVHICLIALFCERFWPARLCLVFFLLLHVDLNNGQLAGVGHRVHGGGACVHHQICHFAAASLSHGTWAGVWVGGWVGGPILTIISLATVLGRVVACGPILTIIRLGFKLLSHSPNHVSKESTLFSFCYPALRKYTCL